MPVSSTVPTPSCIIQADDYSLLDDTWSAAYLSGPNSTVTYSLDGALTALVTGSNNASSSTVRLASAQVTAPPILTIDGTEFAANADSTYYIQVWPGSFDPVSAGDSFTVTHFAPVAYDMPQLQAEDTSSAPAAGQANTTSLPPTATIIAANATTSEPCPCTIAGQNVRLLYFPVTTSYSRDMCMTGLAQGTLCPYASPTVVNAQNSLSIAVEEQVDNGSVCPFVPLNYTSMASLARSIRLHAD